MNANPNVVFPAFKKKVHIEVVVCSACNNEVDVDMKECPACHADFTASEEPRGL